MVTNGIDHAGVAHIRVVVEGIAQVLPHGVGIGKAAVGRVGGDDRRIELVGGDEDRFVVDAAEVDGFDTRLAELADVGRKVSDAFQDISRIASVGRADDASVNGGRQRLGPEPVR